MAHELKELRKFGGVAFMVSGMLFLARHLLDFMAGPPPSSGAEIVAWVESEKLVLSLVSEVLFFAALSLVPAVIALYLSLASVERTKAAIGCGIIAVVIPVLVLLIIVHGRLVYPVYGLRAITPTSVELVVALFYGGLHATGLLFGIATFVLSLAMKRVYWSPCGLSRLCYRSVRCHRCIPICDRARPCAPLRGVLCGVVRCCRIETLPNELRQDSGPVATSVPYQHEEAQSSAK